MSPPAVHNLTFGYPVPGAEKVGNGYCWSWSGVGLMGIVNVTPDSFSDGGQFAGGQSAAADAALIHAQRLIHAGAAILDIGGESTRPGAEPVSAEVELDRILPVLRGLHGAAVLVSVDTYKPEVAAAALRAGAHLINDVSGLRDPEMIEVCVAAGAPSIIMHMQGTPKTMQLAPHYQDVTGEVFGNLVRTAEEALAAGIPAVLLDPGIGFGKTTEHNLELVRALPELVALEYPVLLGASRKGFIRALAGESSGESSVSERDAGSVALHLWGAQQGVSMVRVHNVRAHAQAFRVWAALSG